MNIIFFVKKEGKEKKNRKALHAYEDYYKHVFKGAYILRR